jgi:hypothetical protein
VGYSEYSLYLDPAACRWDRIKPATFLHALVHSGGDVLMLVRLIAAFLLAGFIGGSFGSHNACAERAYGRAWGYTYKTQDWERFYHYPYVYYPQNFWGSEYYRSADSLYYRYPPEMRIPVYNRQWQNYYPQDRKYYQGHHFNLDVF